MSSCKHDHTHDDHDHEHGHDDHEHHHEDGSLKLSPSQIETIELKFGDFSQIKIMDFIKATGKLDVPANSISSLSPKIDGIIKSNKKFVEGQYIAQGSVIAIIENPEIIKTQQEYLELKEELAFTKAEIKRQKALVSADAGIHRNLEKLETQLAMQEAKLMGKAKYLNYVGIDPNNLNVDNMSSSMELRSPGSGYITEINFHRGMYVEPQVVLLKLIDNSHLHLELDVFEKDFVNIQLEQKISYQVPAIGIETFEAEVNLISKEFDPENKTVRIHGHLNGEQPKFIKDMFVTAKIWLNDQVVDALPETALIHEGKICYLFAGKQNSENDIEFEKIMIKPGATNNGYTAVSLIDSIPNEYRIVTEGAYYVYAQSKAGELAHEH